MRTHAHLVLYFGNTLVQGGLQSAVALDGWHALPHRLLARL